MESLYCPGCGRKSLNHEDKKGRMFCDHCWRYWLIDEATSEIHEELRKRYRDNREEFEKLVEQLGRCEEVLKGGA